MKKRKIDILDLTPPRIEMTRSDEHIYIDRSANIPIEFVEQAIIEKALKDGIVIGKNPQFSFWGLAPDRSWVIGSEPPKKYATVSWKDPIEVKP